MRFWRKFCRDKENSPLAAVSYTHLDVYKRQGISGIILIHNIAERGKIIVPSGTVHTLSLIHIWLDGEIGISLQRSLKFLYLYATLAFCGLLVDAH